MASFMSDTLAGLAGRLAQKGPFPSPCDLSRRDVSLLMWWLRLQEAKGKVPVLLNMGQRLTSAILFWPKQLPASQTLGQGW